MSFAKQMLALLMLSLPAVADLVDVDQAEETARQAFIERFSNYSQDKNVMGKASLPNGSTVKGGKKTAFDKDGGGVLPFQSDLTYHDFVFNSEEEIAKGNDPNGKDKQIRTLYGFVSDHGKASAAGGSSRLEREVYSLYNQYAEREEEKGEQQARDEKNGIKFENMFKITTQQVTKKNPTGNAEDDEPEKVERREFRDEVIPQINKVGEESAETIFQASRDQGKENDNKEMPNMTFMRDAASRATEAMYISSLQNLGQRRANKGIRAGLLNKPQLSEALPTCDAFAQEVTQQIQKQQDPDQKQRLLEELNRIQQQCKQMVALPYDVINPRFERQDQSNQQAAERLPEQLKMGEVAKEDGIQRDLRVQLELMSKAGKRAAEVQSNWSYNDKDEKTKLTQYDENGQPIGQIEVTPADQLKGYNDLLKGAQEGYDEVKSRYPQLQVPQMDQYAIQPGTRSTMEINEATPTQMEEFGLEAAPGFQAPTTYDQLIEMGK